MKVLYNCLASRRIRVPAEDIETSAKTIRDLIQELSDREPLAAFADLNAIRCAMIKLSCLLTSLENATVHFPPMTGG